MKATPKLLLKSLEYIVEKSDKFTGFEDEELKGVEVSFHEKYLGMSSEIVFQWKFFFESSMGTPDVVQVRCNESGCRGQAGPID